MKSKHLNLPLILCYIQNLSSLTPDYNEWLDKIYLGAPKYITYNLLISEWECVFFCSKLRSWRLNKFLLFKDMQLHETDSKIYPFLD